MATRKPIKMKQVKNGRMWYANFWHPLLLKAVRVPLSDIPAMAQSRLDWLNKIFMGDSAEWLNPSQLIPQEIRDLWACGQKLRAPQNNQAAIALRAAGELDHFERLCTEQAETIKRLERELEHYRGRKARDGPCPSLKVALETWISDYKGRDADWTRIVHNDLKRFVAEFGPDEECDTMAGREKNIATWLQGLGVGAGRRDQMRKIILRFLTDSGVEINRKLLPGPGKRAVRSDRGAIRWLERDQAEFVSKALTAPWDDYFDVQVAMGFRPDELITIKRSDFHGSNFETITLSPLKHLTLKQGSRTLRVPVECREIFKRRAKENPIIFPNPQTGKPWAKVKLYNLSYNTALKDAAERAGVMITMDCRIGRRTCASLLLRAGVSIERVAAMLGDDPATIREHYATILSHEVDSSAAAI